MKNIVILLSAIVLAGCDGGGSTGSGHDTVLGQDTETGADVVVEREFDVAGDDQASLSDAEVEELSLISEGYTLFAPIQGTTAYLMDNDGASINEWTTPYRPGHAVYLLENGHLLYTGDSNTNVFKTGGAGGVVTEYDWDGDVVWEFVYDDADHRAHHDVEPMPGGNILLIAWERITEAEAIAAGRNPTLIQEGELWPDHLVEVDPSGEIVWEWHVMDHLVQDHDPDKENYGDIAAHPELVDFNYQAAGPPGDSDWNHTNSVDYNPDLDQILISVRNFGEIWIIDHSTTTEEAAGHTGGASGMGGDLLYRWGNPAAYNAGGSEDQRLFVQHDAKWIVPGLPGEGNVLLYNNGTGRPDGNYSTVDELELPVDAAGGYERDSGAFGPEGAVWSYVANPPTGFYSERISGAQRMPNGNTLICRGEDGYFIEVTDAGEVVWAYVSPIQGRKGNPVFRAERYAPDFPGFEGLELTPGPPIGQ